MDEEVLRRAPMRWGAGDLGMLVFRYCHRLGHRPALIVALPETIASESCIANGQFAGIPVQAMEARGGWPHRGWYLWPAD